MKVRSKIDFDSPAGCISKGDVYDVDPGPVGVELRYGTAVLSPHAYEIVTESPPPEPAQKNALRFNQNKPEMFYADMFPLALAEVCRTLEYGTKRPAKPYPRFNWCKGAPWLELYNSSRRHMLAWLKGETNDKEAEEQGFKINNLAFSIGNQLRLLEQELQGRAELDDRYKGPAK